ncbi:MAG: BMP family lipoprotein [Gaiellaceae bacterium]
MKVRRKTVAAFAATIAAVVAVTGMVVASGTASSQQTPLTAALISDVGRFNDKSFNQSQLAGLLRAKRVLKVKALPLQSNSDADYIPNLTTALRRGSGAIVCAGFLMADACAKVALSSQGKTRQFAITDYPVQIPPFSTAKGKLITKNVTGLTYAAQESGCLVGHMAALMVKRGGGPQVIGAVGGIKIPPVDVWIAGYQACAKRANKGIKVLVGYSQDFVDSTKCKAVAENLIAQGAKALFQVAGLCGLGTLKAADEANIWGIGVDVDQYALAGNVLTSGIKRVDEGVFQFIKAVKTGAPLGTGNLTFDLANGGMGLGKTSPQVPKAIVASTEALKQRIIDGKYTPPTVVK